MKRKLLTAILACFTLMMAAQDGAINVAFKGAKPNISDFISAFVASEDENEEEGMANESMNALRQAWDNHKKGLRQPQGVTFTIDQNNGYAIYENKARYGSDEHMLRIEMCYWNESDQKHKLFACSVHCYQNGVCSPGQFDGLTFLRYNNATRKMTYYNNVGFESEYGTNDGDGVAYITYGLPHTGKDITVTTWYKAGKRQKTLKWNGHGFNF